MRRKIVFKTTSARQLSVIGQMMCHQRFQLSDIGQLTSSCKISDLGGKEQPIKIQYFNIGNNNDSSRKKATDLHLTGCCMSSQVNLTSKNKAVNLVVL